MQLHALGHVPLGPACTGEQAIAMAGQCLPDLVWMGVHLGSAMDGIEAAQAIRTQFDGPTVFLSACSGGVNAARFQGARPAGCLEKAFEVHELRDAIDAAFTKP